MTDARCEWRPIGFRVGMRVRHVSMGLGTVQAIEDGFVTVVYDDAPPHTFGKYDERWFAAHPCWIAPAPPDAGKGG